jgi:hypothetical protein
MSRSIVRLASETDCQGQSQRHDKEFLGSVKVVTETFDCFGRKYVRLYALFYLTLISVISYRLTFQHNGAHSRSRLHSRCRSEIVGHNAGIHSRSMWFTDTMARINEARVNSANYYVKGVCDGKTGDVTWILLSDAAYSLYMDAKNCLSPFFVHTQGKTWSESRSESYKKTYI